jgi:molybdopterin/thiamine biosynthesis adenylyltransferase
VRISLWNLRTGNDADVGDEIHDVELGVSLMIGCGAIGSAIAHLMPVAGVKTSLITIDGDDADITNLNRSPLLTFDDLEANKATTVAKFLRSAGMPAREIPMWFDEALAQQRVFDGRPDIVIPAANERHVRHEIQHQVPPLMVYGTTSRDWQAFLGRHIPLREDCLACRFPRRPPIGAPPLRCATGSIDSGQGEPASNDAALPFVSTSGAVLAVAEMIKLAAMGRPLNPNFACVDFRGGLDHVMVAQREAAAGCICGPHRAAWPTINGSSRFSPLSAAT